MSAEFHVMGAYGQQYKTTDAFMKDWEAGKDMAVYPGGRPYLSIRDSATLKRDGYTKLHAHLSGPMNLLIDL
jgi:hypothetical protein